MKDLFNLFKKCDCGGYDLWSLRELTEFICHEFLHIPHMVNF